MFGILFEGKEYIFSRKTNRDKYNNAVDLFDKLDIILEDMQNNAVDSNDSVMAHCYQKDLKNDKSKLKLERLYIWMNKIRSHWFEFEQLNEEDEFSEEKYILFDVWWNKYKFLCDELQNYIATM
jgi:hypothetical protein